MKNKKNQNTLPLNKREDTYFKFWDFYTKKIGIYFNLVTVWIISLPRSRAPSIKRNYQNNWTTLLDALEIVNMNVIYAKLSLHANWSVLYVVWVMKCWSIHKILLYIQIRGAQIFEMQFMWTFEISLKEKCS